MKGYSSIGRYMTDGISRIYHNCLEDTTNFAKCLLLAGTIGLCLNTAPYYYAKIYLHFADPAAAGDYIEARENAQHDRISPNLILDKLIWPAQRDAIEEYKEKRIQEDLKEIKPIDPKFEREWVV